MAKTTPNTEGEKGADAQDTSFLAMLFRALSIGASVNVKETVEPASKDNERTITSPNPASTLSRF
jgi:hypothetical protein